MEQAGSLFYEKDVRSYRYKSAGTSRAGKPFSDWRLGSYRRHCHVVYGFDQRLHRALSVVERLAANRCTQSSLGEHCFDSDQQLDDGDRATIFETPE
jgi:hypothetical protein